MIRLIDLIKYDIQSKVNWSGYAKNIIKIIYQEWIELKRNVFSVLLFFDTNNILRAYMPIVSLSSDYSASSVRKFKKTRENSEIIGVTPYQILRQVPNDNELLAIEEIMNKEYGWYGTHAYNLCQCKRMSFGKEKTQVVWSVNPFVKGCINVSANKKQIGRKPNNKFFNENYITWIPLSECLFIFSKKTQEIYEKEKVIERIKSNISKMNEKIRILNNYNDFYSLKLETKNSNIKFEFIKVSKIGTNKTSTKTILLNNNKFVSHYIYIFENKNITKQNVYIFMNNIKDEIIFDIIKTYRVILFLVGNKDNNYNISLKNIKINDVNNKYLERERFSFKPEQLKNEIIHNKAASKVQEQEEKKYFSNHNTQEDLIITIQVMLIIASLNSHYKLRWLTGKLMYLLKKLEFSIVCDQRKSFFLNK